MIEDPIRERTYNIQCNSWLSSRSNDQKLMRDFTVTTIISQRHQSESRGNETFEKKLFRKSCSGFVVFQFVEVKIRIVPIRQHSIVVVVHETQTTHETFDDLDQLMVDKEIRIKIDQIIHQREEKILRHLRLHHQAQK